MRITYKAIRVVPVTPANPLGFVEAEFKVNDNDASNIYIRKMAEAAMRKATGNDRVHGWSLDDSQNISDRQAPMVIA